MLTAKIRSSPIQLNVIQGTLPAVQIKDCTNRCLTLLASGGTRILLTQRFEDILVDDAMAWAENGLVQLRALVITSRRRKCFFVA